MMKTYLINIDDNKSYMRVFAEENFLTIYSNDGKKKFTYNKII